jgi:hypothetical protein
MQVLPATGQEEDCLQRGHLDVGEASITCLPWYHRTVAKVSRRADNLVKMVEGLLDSPNPRDRVRAIHHISEGVKLLEYELVADAREQEMTWSEIGRLLRMSRQAAQQRYGAVDDTEDTRPKIVRTRPGRVTIVRT